MPKGVYPRFPASLESEKLVLGAILNGQEEPLTELEPDDFYDEGLCRAYKACQAVFGDGSTVSPVLVFERSGVAVEVLTELCKKAKDIKALELQGIVK